MTQETGDKQHHQQPAHLAGAPVKLFIQTLLAVMLKRNMLMSKAFGKKVLLSVQEEPTLLK